MNSLGHGGPADPQPPTCKLAKGAEEVGICFSCQLFKKHLSYNCLCDLLNKWVLQNQDYHQCIHGVNPFFGSTHEAHTSHHYPKMKCPSKLAEIYSRRVTADAGTTDSGVYILWIPRNVVRQLMLTYNFIEPTYIVYVGTHHIYLCICTYASFTFCTWFACVHTFE